MLGDRRIMFVGEDQALWPDLLRCSSQENWRMMFARTASEALVALDEQDFDAVVTNLDVSGMTGTELLQEIRERKPNVWRFLRAEPQASHETAHWAGAADQLIETPLDAQGIQTRLAQAFDKGFWRPHPVAQNLLHSCPLLPSPPKMYHRMLTMMASPNTSMEKIGALIEEDPAMAAKILKLVNSAVFGLQQNVTSAGEAVMYLGIETTKAIILMAHTVASFSAVERARYPVDKLLKHSFMTARYSRWISRVEAPRGQTGDIAFTGGLLHDIGKLLLAANHGEAYARCIDFSRKAKRPLTWAEREFFGTDHANLGGSLLSSWGLPQPIVESVALHHGPEWLGESNAFNATTAVHAANVLSQEEHVVAEGLVPASFDFAYLTGGGFFDNVEKWRDTCKARG